LGNWFNPMKLRASLPIPLILMLVSVELCGFCGCKEGQRQDTVLSSAANPSHTYRATVILRQFYSEGKLNNSPTTYVLLDRDSGAPNYLNGMDFRDSQVVMSPTQCGTLSLQWGGDWVLKIRCEQCGLALSGAGPHAQGMGAIRIEYEGFPETSSWEAGSRTN
jgi:hypothetical protein